MSHESIKNAITFTIQSHGIFCNIPDLSKLIIEHGIKMAPAEGLPIALEGSISWHSGMPEMTVGIPDPSGEGFSEYVSVYAGDGQGPIDYDTLRDRIAKAIFENKWLKAAVLG